MTDFVVADEGELAVGEHLVVQLEGREIGVFNVDGDLYAYTNWCAHQSGPICEGFVGGTCVAAFDEETLAITQEWEREGEILTCPWHGWEYELTSGECLSRHGISLPQHDVRVDEGQIVVSL